jgi:hypothetical protein
MKMAREDEVRLIAYRLWEEEGCPTGHDCEHWLRAEVVWEQQRKPVKPKSIEPKEEPKTVTYKSGRSSIKPKTAEKKKS